MNKYKKYLFFLSFLIVLSALFSCYLKYYQTMWRNEYNDWVITFKYPKDIVVSDKEFEDFKYFEKDTLHVQKYNLDSFIWLCDSDKSSFKRDESYFRKIIQEIKEWKWGSIDHISCNETVGDIKTTPITIDWINWLVINYYFTQDDELWCLSQFNTELLLVKDINNIYSFVVKNNFWEIYDYLVDYKDESWEACIYNFECRSTEKYQQEAKDASNIIQEYYKNWKSLLWTHYKGFENNDEIIKHIFQTLKIKEKIY